MYVRRSLCVFVTVQAVKFYLSEYNLSMFTLTCSLEPWQCPSSVANKCPNCLTWLPKQLCLSIASFVNALSSFNLDARENPPKTALIGGICERKIHGSNNHNLSPTQNNNKKLMSKGGRIMGELVVFFVSLLLKMRSNILKLIIDIKRNFI